VGRTEYLRRYGPYALVAGASRGIGAALAEQLAGRGLSLVLIARTDGELEALAAGLRQRHAIDVVTLGIDLSASDATARIMAATEGTDIGLLVYNAAIGFSGAFWARDLGYYHELLATNLLTPFDLVHQLAPRLMRQRRGGIIMISSAAGQTGQPYLTAYAGTKAWNTSFSMGLWAELRPYGVDVLNAIVGSTDTPGLRDMMQESFLQRIRLATPQDVAAETLASLGRRPTRIIGARNRLTMGFFRLIGLNASLKAMSRLMSGVVYNGKPPAQPINEPVPDPGTATPTPP
jgi:uncharacterized protein